MTKIRTIVFALVLLVSTALWAQPSSVRKAGKSVFTLTTFKKDGTLQGSCRGVFIDDQGTALSPFGPFVGADSATVVDASGKATAVDYILGADENYDVVKFKVIASTHGIAIAPQAIPAGSAVWQIPYSTSTPKVQSLNIKRVEKFNTSYNYYVSDFTSHDTDYGCPVVNADGQLVGLLKALDDSTVSIIDANYIQSLKVTALSCQTFNQTGIRTGLPDNESDATTAMFLARTLRPKADNYKYAREFIEKFPTSAQGYKSLAELLAADSLYAEADKELQLGVAKALHKDETHSNYAALVYNQVVYNPNKKFAPWTLDKALDEASRAYQAKPDPAYLHQQAQVIYAQGNYPKAYQMFMDLTRTPLNNGELWFECAQCKTQMKAPDQEIKVLLDSAVSVSSRRGLAGPYLLARGQFYDARQQYREAIQDYYAYDSVSHTTDPAFFYMRYQCEIKARMWQQALLDIARASYLNPKEPLYMAEWASLDLRVKRYDEAISAATRCTQLAPDYADGYLLLGLAQIEKGLKTEGLQNLEKAKSLGDSRAQEFIDKNK